MWKGGGDEHCLKSEICPLERREGEVKINLGWSKSKLMVGSLNFLSIVELGWIGVGKEQWKVARTQFLGSRKCLGWNHWCGNGEVEDKKTDIATSQRQSLYNLGAC